MRKSNIFLTAMMLSAIFFGCRSREPLCYYTYPSEFYYWEVEPVKMEVYHPPKEIPIKPKEETLPPERQPEVKKAIPVQKKEYIPPMAPGKLKRRQVSKPYGLVIPFSEQCCEEEDRREKAKNKPDDWEKISAWIYKD